MNRRNPLAPLCEEEVPFFLGCAVTKSQDIWVRHQVDGAIRPPGAAYGGDMLGRFD